MPNTAMNFASKFPSKLLLVTVFLYLLVPAAWAKEPYADVFAFIQKMQTMHPRDEIAGFIAAQAQRLGEATAQAFALLDRTGESS